TTSTQNRSFFFFFQAEDGIRDFHVTGVQTCALPISTSPGSTTSRTGDVARMQRNGFVPVVVEPGDVEPTKLVIVLRNAAGRQVEIGRASCRERGEIAVGGGGGERKEGG